MCYLSREAYGEPCECPFLFFLTDHIRHSNRKKTVKGKNEGSLQGTGSMPQQTICHQTVFDDGDSVFSWDLRWEVLVSFRLKFSR